MQPEFDSKFFNENAADICRRLLDKDEKTRLGANGCNEIMSHPWFRDMNWEEIIADRKRPPFVPPKDVNAASQSDIGTFAEDKKFQDTVLDEKDQAVYAKWQVGLPRAKGLSTPACLLLTLVISLFQSSRTKRRLPRRSLSFSSTNGRLVR